MNAPVVQPFAISGAFTLLRHVMPLDRAGLESLVGFEPGRLAVGFRIVALDADETILADELLLDGSSRWSDGRLPNPTFALEATEMESLLAWRGQDVAGLRERVASFLARRGANTPAKVIPLLRHRDGMRYPEGRDPRTGARLGVPQFRLRDRIAKRATVVRVG